MVFLLYMVVLVHWILMIYLYWLNYQHLLFTLCFFYRFYFNYMWFIFQIRCCSFSCMITWYYGGSLYIVTFFISIIPKISVFIYLFRFYFLFIIYLYFFFLWFFVTFCFSLFSIIYIIGTIGALYERTILRFVAYSSITILVISC